MIEAGPVTVRGPGPVPWDLAATAVECIDDAIALIDDEPVSVEELWAEVLRAAAVDDGAGVVLVCPTWWTRDQVERVRAAAAAAFGEAVVMSRAEVVAAGRDDAAWAVVEIADELVVISRPDAMPVRVVRSDTETVVTAVAAAVATAHEVIVDAPADVTQSGELGRLVAERLRRNGIPVVVVATLSLPPPDEPEPSEPDARSGAVRGRVAVCTGLALAAVFAAGAAAMRTPSTSGESTVTLVEGRVGMQVPAGWTVERLTGGAGSARVQASSPAEPVVALHLTQSGVPPGRLEDSLRRALDEQPAGVFVDFNPHDRVAGRDVVSYRELRGQRQVRWIVLIDKAVRIAIGCQSAPQRPDTVQAACEAAVRSAHALF